VLTEKQIAGRSRFSKDSNLIFRRDSPLMRQSRKIAFPSKNSMDIVVATFYKFIKIPNLAEKQESLRQFCQKHGIKGTILLAHEGINGTIAGTNEAVEHTFIYLRQDPLFHDLNCKESYTDHPPFKRLKIRLKKEIVTIGIPEVDPTTTVGTYIEAKDWNQLIGDPNVVVIDTRNDYEVNLGSFQGAINPQTSSFREFPAYIKNHLNPNRQTKVAIFCTGGIRCEKASAYLLSQGFQEVYHLKGGILQYLAEIPAAESLWQGECFVFDDRVAVTHDLNEGHYQLCVACGRPIPQQEVSQCSQCLMDELLQTSAIG
jgi:UPF0176 protein